VNAPEAATTYDGVDAGVIASRCGIPQLTLLATVPSTMDAAHHLAAAGAPAGSLVLTEVQTAGRGRGGRMWQSEAGTSITCTLIDRPQDPSALAVLSLRMGIGIAEALQRFSQEPLLVKWPNDLMRGPGKLGGILSEARWRDGRPEWVAIGVGLNVRSPSAVTGGAGLEPGVSRVDVLVGMVAAMRAACWAEGELSTGELARFRSRDWSWGRLVEQPERGVARGITTRGELIVETSHGPRLCSAGSLTLAEEAHAAGS
jgi:BirA family biotin operon repressor/biotin-[acetyl-CoA-carboxylase] ligase